MYMYCIKKDTKSWNWGDIEMKQEKLKILIISKKKIMYYLHNKNYIKIIY